MNYTGVYAIKKYLWHEDVIIILTISMYNIIVQYIYDIDVIHQNILLYDGQMDEECKRIRR